MSLNNKSILLFLGLAFFISSASFAQTDTAFLSKAITSLENYTSANANEKVYLQSGI